MLARTSCFVQVVASFAAAAVKQTIALAARSNVAVIGGSGLAGRTCAIVWQTILAPRPCRLVQGVATITSVAVQSSRNFTAQVGR